MLDDRYEIKIESDLHTFEFVSEGPKGRITKVVVYAETGTDGLYTLGFGDKDEATGHLNDLVITNNGDSQKVLATVAQTLFVFTDTYPGIMVAATGSTEARTRLYRIGITNNLEVIERNFIVFGLAEGTWQEFRKAVKYDAFLVRRKQ